VILRRLVDTLTLSSTPAADSLQQERRLIDDRIRNFDVNHSKPFVFFQERGWGDLKFPELKSICEVLSQKGRVPMDREAKRRKSVLFKWLEDNWVQLRPLVEELKLVFEGQHA
jgi:hypothetical protein